MARHVTRDMTLDELLGLSELAPYQRYMVYAPSHVSASELPISGIRQRPLSAVTELGWSPEAIREGMEALLDAADEGRVSLHHVYEDADDPVMRDVSLIRLAPADLDPTRPFVLLCSGGAYKNVCNIAEGITVGRHVVEAGLQAYLLTYRVSVPEVLPHALDDVGAALAWMSRHGDELAVDIERYAIAGFSAGGNLACTWGLPHVGFRAHGMPAPQAILAAYACVDLELESRRNDAHGMLPRMFGEAWRGRMGAYDVVTNAGGDYPACYIVCGRNDALLSCAHSEALKRRLDAVGVTAVLEECEDAPHGFGDGTGTDAHGWPERALAFLTGPDDRR